ncbi:MAG: hypothetical protein JO158_00655 [Gammaproteobacteria bacterium]|nr:hypothetical protein [Gammaproteobacteria bacterium]MBV9724253.1 hypothetical protein [Gammaproteobacteria bacterium]
MRARGWALLGSLVINLMLALVIVTVFSVSRPARAAESAQCPTHPAPTGRQSPAPPARSGQRYIVAVRMGWAMG